MRIIHVTLSRFSTYNCLLSSCCPDSFKPVIHLPLPQMTTLRQQRAVPRKRIPLTYLLNFNFFEKKVITLPYCAYSYYINIYELSDIDNPVFC
jgi:hypothetical protein